MGRFHYFGEVEDVTALSLGDRVVTSKGGTMDQRPREVVGVISESMNQDCDYEGRVPAVVVESQNGIRDRLENTDAGIEMVHVDSGDSFGIRTIKKVPEGVDVGRDLPEIEHQEGDAALLESVGEQLTSDEKRSLAGLETDEAQIVGDFDPDGTE